MTNNRRRIITAAAAAAATIAASLLPAMQMHRAATAPRPAPAAHTCTAEVILFEDGSWLGGALRYDGRLIDRSWDDRMPRYGWLPGYTGTPCKLTIAK